jgi:hypothetical protein
MTMYKRSMVSETNTFDAKRFSLGGTIINDGVSPEKQTRLIEIKKVK